MLWGLSTVNDLTPLIRARDFPTPAAALRDAEGLLAQASRFRAVPVHDPNSARRSMWVGLNGRIVLFAGQAWRPHADSTERVLSRLLRRCGSRPGGDDLGHRSLLWTTAVGAE